MAIHLRARLPIDVSYGKADATGCENDNTTDVRPLGNVRDLG